MDDAASKLKSDHSDNYAGAVGEEEHKSAGHPYVTSASNEPSNVSFEEIVEELRGLRASLADRGTTALTLGVLTENEW